LVSAIAILLVSIMAAVATAPFAVSSLAWWNAADSATAGARAAFWSATWKPVGYDSNSANLWSNCVFAFRKCATVSKDSTRKDVHKEHAVCN